MELKARHVVDVYDNYSKHPCEESSQVYLKSEVDKVIAEKDTKIIQLEALIENYNRISGEIIDNANHHKYKRCLATARWCYSMDCRMLNEASDSGTYFKESWFWKRASWYGKWKCKWLELAEKFKKARQ